MVKIDLLGNRAAHVTGKFRKPAAPWLCTDSSKDVWNEVKKKKPPDPDEVFILLIWWREKKNQWIEKEFWIKFQVWNLLADTLDKLLKFPHLCSPICKTPSSQMQACQFLKSTPYTHKAYLYMSTIQDLIWHTVVLNKFVKGIKVN